MIYPNIHYEMKRNGLTDRHLALILGLPLNRLIFKLYGKAEFSLHEIEQLSVLLNCSLDYLVGHRVKSGPQPSGEEMDSMVRRMMSEILMRLYSVT